MVRELNKQTVEKSLKNLHYMMNNHYQIEDINEAKEKLKLQIAGRQFRAPYAQSRIFGMNDINRYIELAIEKHELKKKSKSKRLHDMCLKKSFKSQTFRVLKVIKSWKLQYVMSYMAARLKILRHLQTPRRLICIKT